jgi:lipopolysaccharide/colanic/teichoic acid biosynthesis glycosyltransferase
MSIQPTLYSVIFALSEQGSVWTRRACEARSARFLLLGVISTFICISSPALLALCGIGMSGQDGGVVSHGAVASLLAIVISFFIIRRLLSFPLLRIYGYVALTFVSNFAIVSIGLKFLRIDFSSPQFFLGMVMITAMIELLLYVYRHRASLHIAVVPGTANLIWPSKTIGRAIKFTQLIAVSTELDYNGIVADLNAQLSLEWEQFLAISALRGIPVYHVKQFNESMTGRVAFDHLSENSLGAIVPALMYPQFKRILDVLCAMVVLPIAGLIVGISAILIKLETPGPAFYHQLRMGLGGHPFTIFKLRTMTVDHNGDAFTGSGDSRVTRMGRFLRRYRLDELPQIVNILRGDMSWIGPRPEAISLAAWYEREIPFYIYRHIVRPGITGWAQVHQGNVAAVEAARLKLEYDFFYIKNFSFWLDAVITVKTLVAIVTGFGWR